jgi:hypothetical protein
LFSFLQRIVSWVMILDVFGQRIEAIRTEKCWKIFYLGTDGKKRPASDIAVPWSVQEEDLARYLDDLRHEYATPENPSIRVLNQ